MDLSASVRAQLPGDRARGRSSTTPPSRRCRRRPSRPCATTPTTSPRTASPRVKTWIDRVAEVRRCAARLINAPSPDDVVFVPNTTHGIGVVAEGFPWQPGDNVVLAGRGVPGEPLPVDEPRRPRRRSAHVPSRGSRARHRRHSRRDGRPHARAGHLSSSSSPAASATTSTPSANSAASAASSSSWTRSRGSACFRSTCSRRRSTPSRPTATSGCSARKGPGIGYVRREWVERLHPIGVGGEQRRRARCDFSTIDFRLKPHAGRWEGGALTSPGITALGASLELLLDAGIDDVERRVLELTDYLCDRARRRGLDGVQQPRPRASSPASCRWSHPARRPGEVVKRCRAAG